MLCVLCLSLLLHCINFGIFGTSSGGLTRPTVISSLLQINIVVVVVVVVM